MNQKTLERLLDACAANDERAIRETIGWGTVYDTLKGGWAKKLIPMDFAPYVRILAGHEPEEVLLTVVAIAPASEYRPTPAAIAGALTPAAAPELASRRRLRPDQSERAYRAVLMAVACGDDVCECMPRPANVTVDADDVLWCPDCGGIETGQHDAALEWQEAQ